MMAVVPATRAAPETFPAVKDLPVRQEMPDAMTMDDGTKVTTVAQWRVRREEMKAILEHYELGHAPPPPGNVSGQDLKIRPPAQWNGELPAGAFEIRTGRKPGVRHRDFHAGEKRRSVSDHHQSVVL